VSQNTVSLNIVLEDIVLEDIVGAFPSAAESIVIRVFLSQVHLHCTYSEHDLSLHL
jgi:hypothetical protein